MVSLRGSQPEGPRHVSSKPDNKNNIKSVSCDELVVVYRWPLISCGLSAECEEHVLVYLIANLYVLNIIFTTAQ